MKILLIDNIDIDLRIVQKMLERNFDEPYELIVHHTLEAGKPLFSDTSIDLVFLDLHLPDSNIDSTLAIVEQYEEHLPFIILSGINDREFRIKAIQKGAQDYLVKNEFDGPLLIRSINYSIERHRLHKELHIYTHQLEDKERKLIESQVIAQIGNWEYDPSSLSLIWSGEAINILELENGKTSTSVDDFIQQIHAEEQTSADQIFRQAIDENCDFNVDFSIRLANGKQKYINLRVRSEIERDKKDIRIRGTIQDITSRKEIEAALAASEDKYHRLFEESRDAVYITTEGGKFMDFNKATLDLFGYTEKELKKIDVASLYFNPYEREKAKKAITKEGFVRDFELKLKKKDGTKLDCLITSTVWQSNNGRKKGYQGIIRDITAQKRTEELIRNKEIAERSSRLKQRFFANMSHEIRTPINAISGLTHLLLKTELSVPQKEYINGIKNSSDHLIALVNDILDYSKIEEGKIRFDAIPFDLKEHLNQLVNTMEYSAQKKNIALKVDLDNEIPKTLVGDPIKLNQIVLNLLSNAIKFTDEGFVALKAQMVDDSKHAAVISVTVQDTGMGIPENKLDTIFRSFTQLGKNITKVAEGTGLCLAITKQLVELQGGTINVKSKENEGSVFKVTMMFKKKAATNHQPEEEEEKKEVENIGYKKMLVVDDKKLNQLVTSEMIKGWWPQVEITFADHGQAALDILKEKKFDLILMDVQMPVMDGYDATSEIRNNEIFEAVDVPILAMTAYSTTGEAEKCLQAGMNDYIVKPFDPDKLYKKILALIYNKAPAESKPDIPKPEPEKIKDDRLDLNYLYTITGGNEELKNKIIDLLIEETPQEIDLLRKFTEERNWKRVRAIAHKMKSGISYMGLNRALDLAKDIEEYADQEQNLNKIPEMVDKVTESCTKAIHELTATQIVSR